MGLEAATFINQLVATNPVGATDPKSQGDDHLRLIKSALQATFAAITGAVTATHTELNQLHAGVISSVGNGTAALPTYSFASDPDTGVYRAAANTLAVTVGGVEALEIGASGVSAIVRYLCADGAVGAPAYSYNSDPDTGVYRIAANRLGLAAGAAAVAEVGINYFQVNPGMFIYGPDGAVGAPGYSFANDPDTGVFRSGANGVSLSAGGATALTADTVSLYIRDGTAANPAITFLGDTDTGFYRVGANIVGVGAGGVEVVRFINNGSVVITNFSDGSVGTPGIGFSSDGDTGFYKSAADQIAIALGGVTAGQIAQGTFVATLTGCATAPTVTVEWQRVGNIVHLYVPAVTAVSNVNTCTLTGAPAIIRPATHRSGQQSIYAFNDNGGLTTGSVGADMDTAGTIAFYRGGSLTGFTAVNSKGPSFAFEMQYKIN